MNSFSTSGSPSVNISHKKILQKLTSKITTKKDFKIKLSQNKITSGLQSLSHNHDLVQ